MRRLILMRHCKSSWASADLADHDRPLNARGARSAAALGAWLRDAGHQPDLALVSTSRRTQETFGGLDLTCPVALSSALYHASAEAILREIEAIPEDVLTLLVIGHNPGFAEVAWRLARTAPAHPRFCDYPTGATTLFDLDLACWTDITWGKGNARDFVIPRALLEG